MPNTAAAIARRSPTSLMTLSIAPVATWPTSGLGRRELLLDDHAEVLEPGVLALLLAVFFAPGEALGREQDLDQKAIGGRAIGDDQQLGRLDIVRVGRGLPQLVQVVVVEGAEEAAQAGHADAHRAAFFLGGV